MVKRVASDTPGRPQPDNVAACVRALNHTIGELARGYGAPSVAAALAEVMGCASCIAHTVDRASGIFARVERIERGR